MGIERGEIVVEINGHKFTWQAEVRAVSRKMVRDVLEINEKYPAFFAYAKTVQLKNQLPENESEAVVLPPVSPMDAYAVADEALEFFYRWNSAMRSKKKILDEANEIDLYKAFGEVVAFISAPFARVEAVEATTPT